MSYRWEEQTVGLGVRRAEILSLQASTAYYFHVKLVRDARHKVETRHLGFLNMSSSYPGLPRGSDQKSLDPPCLPAGFLLNDSHLPSSCSRGDGNWKPLFLQVNTSSSNPKAVVIVVVIVMVVLASLLALLYMRRKDVTDYLAQRRKDKEDLEFSEFRTGMVSWSQRH